MFYVKYRNRFMVTACHAGIVALYMTPRQWSALATSQFRGMLFEAVEKANAIDQMRALRLPTVGAVSHRFH